MVHVMSEVKKYNAYAEGLTVHFELDSEGAWVAASDFDAQRLRADTAEAELAKLNDLHNAVVQGGKLVADHLAAAEQRIAELMSILKNPTDEMIEAGNNSAAVQMEHDSELGSYAWIDNSGEILAAMVDAALNPSPEAESHE
jgi:hypothetical protein